MVDLQALLLAASKTRSFNPDWTVSPGEVLAEVIEELPTTQAELARAMGVSLKYLNQIVKGKQTISIETAILLEENTSISARFWLTLEMEHRLFLARQNR